MLSLDISYKKDLKELHRKTEATIVFITHDITEALKLGTKVLVLDKGEIQQYDVPKNICSNPKNDFVKQLLKNGRDVEQIFKKMI